MNIKDELKSMEAEEFCGNCGKVMRAICINKAVGRFSFTELCHMLVNFDMDKEEILEVLDYFEDKGYIETKDTDGNIIKPCDIDDERDLVLRLTGEGRLIAKGIKEDIAIKL